MKTRLLVVLCFLPFGAFCQKQYFSLFPDSFAASGDTSNESIVIQYPGRTAAQLYSAIRSVLPSVFQTTKYQESHVKDQTISVHWDVEGSVPLKTSFGEYKKECFFSPTMVWHIKDGKIKIDAPQAIPLKGTNSNVEGDFTLFLSKKTKKDDPEGPPKTDIYMFEFDGSVNKRTINVKAALESEINTFVGKVLEGMDKEMNVDW
ncbi:MAG: hypothetical protein DI598_11935 [Pseudopedobacter saltans]|uniref:DUF4468 domain-containing protein n=1 Tax=Pseudopedobacter saltans TaxID=151895 RepID=A0A2W5EXA1_9SPHI|nr:MAG: hypothetical protein DI598_11935 [Pseudopedobacter saltans]